MAGKMDTETLIKHLEKEFSDIYGKDITLENVRNNLQEGKAKLETELRRLFEEKKPVYSEHLMQMNIAIFSAFSMYTNEEKKKFFEMLGADIFRYTTFLD